MQAAPQTAPGPAIAAPAKRRVSLFMHYNFPQDAAPCKPN